MMPSQNLGAKLGRCTCPDRESGNKRLIDLHTQYYRLSKQSKAPETEKSAKD